MMKPLPNQTKGVVSKQSVRTHPTQLQFQFSKLSLYNVASPAAVACLILN